MTLACALQVLDRIITDERSSNRLLPTPYRIAVFATGLRRGKRYPKYSTLVETHYGYMGWNPAQFYQEARLPDAGSFLYPGIAAVRDAAAVYLALPCTRQVQIRTDQDRKVYIFNKHSDGRITGYAPGVD